MSGLREALAHLADHERERTRRIAAVLAEAHGPTEELSPEESALLAAVRSEVAAALLAWRLDRMERDL